MTVVATARRWGVPDSAVEGVRLAVGEACARALRMLDPGCVARLIVHAEQSPDGAFVVRVYDPVDQDGSAVPGQHPVIPPVMALPVTPPGDLPGYLVAERAAEDEIALAIIRDVADEVCIISSLPERVGRIEMTWCDAISPRARTMCH